MKRDIDSFGSVYFKAPDELLAFYRDLAQKENRLLRSCFIDALKQYKSDLEKGKASVPTPEKNKVEKSAALDMSDIFG